MITRVSAAATLAFVAVAGCSSGSGQPAGPPSSHGTGPASESSTGSTTGVPPATNYCTLLTATQINAVTGDKMGSGDRSSGSSCRWYNDSGNAWAYVSVTSDKPCPPSNLALTSSDVTKQPVSGLGDAAAYYLSGPADAPYHLPMSVTRGEACIVLEVQNEHYHGNGFTADDQRRADKQLAQDVLTGLDAQNPTLTAQFSPCAFLTDAQVNTALGEPSGSCSLDSFDVDQGEPVSNWNAKQDGDPSLELAFSREEYEADKEYHQKDTTPAPGIGDDAVFSTANQNGVHTPTLRVKKGDRYFELQLTSSKNALSNQQIIAAEKTLGLVIVGQL